MEKGKLMKNMDVNKISGILFFVSFVFAVVYFLDEVFSYYFSPWSIVVFLKSVFFLALGVLLFLKKNKKFLLIPQVVAPVLNLIVIVNEGWLSEAAIFVSVVTWVLQITFWVLMIINIPQKIKNVLGSWWILFADIVIFGEVIAALGRIWLWSLVFNALGIILMNYSLCKKYVKIKKRKITKAKREITETDMGDYIYNITGARGRRLYVYDDRCVIVTKPGIGSLITGNVADGEKTIYYTDCIGVQFKESHKLIGYLQLETASSSMNNRKDNFFNENSFTFEETQISNEKMREIAEFIKEKIAATKQNKNAPVVTASVSSADELRKFKSLLDDGIITQEEFDKKKKELLGL